MRKWVQVLLVFSLAMLPSRPTLAWGPHTEITLAAFTALTNRGELQAYFGDDLRRIARDYVWMADWRSAVRPDHYADDYLLFPAFQYHPSHLLPEVRQTYGPFFRRALQAIRTESPENAARWIGSLLHFVQDSGSPPHTLAIGGLLHTKMERWVDESKISIDGYTPQLLGSTDAEAIAGFDRRMAELVEYSRARAVRLQSILPSIDKRENQPLELESAKETARVTADVIHTLWTLRSLRSKTNNAGLVGKVAFQPPSSYAHVAPKVTIAGTNFSTVCDADGLFAFRNLPPGQYRIDVLTTGYRLATIKNVVLRSGQKTRLNIGSTSDTNSSNLVRNANLSLHWIDPQLPDWWRRDTQRPAYWTASLIRVPVTQACRLAVTYEHGERCPIAVRWRTNPAIPGGRPIVRLVDAVPSESKQFTTQVKPDLSAKPFESGFLYLEIMLETARPLADVCRHISLTFDDKP